MSLSQFHVVLTVVFHSNYRKRRKSFLDKSGKRASSDQAIAGGKPTSRYLSLLRE